MESIPKNIILDLLPAVIAGEASEESIALVEAYAKHDDQIAEFLSTGSLGDDLISSEINVPEDLEMRTLKRVHRSIRQQMWVVALATASLLLIPMVAMMLTNEVNWGLLDFIVMGALFMGTGMAYVLISKMSERIAYKAGVGVAVLAGLLLISINLAVGFIGSEGNSANLLYASVFFVAILGMHFARYRAEGMARTMFITALVQMLVPVVALIFWRPAMEASPGILGIFIINAIFAGLFIGSGLLFRRAGRTL